MGKVTILDTTTRNPISLIGERAGICWGADTSSHIKNYQRGLDCITSGHGRTLEFVQIDMVISGYSARVIREYMRHVGGGLTVLQASTRYIDYGEFEYIIPKSIKENPTALEEYERCMRHIRDAAQFIELQCELPREDVANLLPLGMTTKLVDHKNLRNLIDMSHQRLCNRAYWEFQQIMDDICDALTEYGKDSGEWETIVKTQFVPKCEVLGYCPEKNSCGRKPKKGESNVKID